MARYVPIAALQGSQFPRRDAERIYADNSRSSTSDTWDANTPHTQPVCVAVATHPKVQEMPREVNRIDQRKPVEREQNRARDQDGTVGVASVPRMQLREAMATEG
jgi:hypothetical protein